jgi:hypothetical protein
LLVGLQQAGVFQKETKPQTSLCEKLADHSIDLDANEYHGVVGPSGIQIETIAREKVRFETIVKFSNQRDVREFSTELSDPIVGTCEGKNIAFERTLRNGVVQRFTGSISEKAEEITMGGTFGEGSEKYVWKGRVVSPPGR